MAFPLYTQEVEHQLGHVSSLRRLQEKSLLQLFMVHIILRIEQKNFIIQLW